MYWSLAITSGPALVVTFGATMAALLTLRRLAYRVGWVDRPGGRKVHLAATPVVGGVAIALGTAPAAFALFELTPAVQSLALAAAVILAIGVLDDLFDLAWPLRFAGQALAGLILVYVGDVRIEQLGPLFGADALWLGPLGAPFTVLATIGLINAMNMADGVDGLAAALSACAMAMIAAAALYAGNTRLAEGALVFLGALLAFLLFNLRHPGQPQASVFLGNAGSELLGLVIAWSCFRLTQNGLHPVEPALAPFLIAPAVVDCLVVMARRIRRGRSPFRADRNHLHHLMLDAQVGVSAIVATVCSLSLLLAAAAGAALLVDSPPSALVLAFVALTLGYYVWTMRWDSCVATVAKIFAVHIPAAAPLEPDRATPAPERPAADGPQPAPAQLTGVPRRRGRAGRNAPTPAGWPDPVLKNHETHDGIGLFR